MKTAILFLCVCTLTGCHTMGESSSYSNSQQTSYQTKNQDGETVHRTVRVAERYPVVVTPVTPTYPQPTYPPPTYPQPVVTPVAKGENKPTRPPQAQSHRAKQASTVVLI